MIYCSIINMFHIIWFVILEYFLIVKLLWLDLIYILIFDVLYQYCLYEWWNIVMGTHNLKVMYVKVMMLKSKFIKNLYFIFSIVFHGIGYHANVPFINHLLINFDQDELQITYSGRSESGMESSESTSYISTIIVNVRT